MLTSFQANSLTPEQVLIKKTGSLQCGRFSWASAGIISARASKNTPALQARKLAALFAIWEKERIRLKRARIFEPIKLLSFKTQSYSCLPKKKLKLK